MKTIFNLLIPFLLISFGILLLVHRHQPALPIDVAPAVDPMSEINKTVLSPANRQLVKDGLEIKVKSIVTGVPHEYFQLLAQRHAEYQANVRVQGHQGWEDRYAYLRANISDCRDFVEVANESWPGQSVEDAAAEMYHSWKQSPGHWGAVNGECKYYGYAMVLGKNGTWYSCGIFGK